MAEAARLLVRVDDAGTSLASNEGCLTACVEGIARSVEVMMPGAWVHHAAERFGRHPDIDVGIHLTLTSEWDAVKWRPLTGAASLVDAQGFFWPRLFAIGKGDAECVQNGGWQLEDVAAEFEAQIALGLKLFSQASHISSHMVRHFKDFDPLLGVLISDLCTKFGLMDDGLGDTLDWIDGYPKFPRDPALRETEFIRALEGLRNGTHIFLDHPAPLTEETQALGHDGYRDVAEDRAACLAVLASAPVREAVKRLGIELIGYRSLPL